MRSVSKTSTGPSIAVYAAPEWPGRYLTEQPFSISAALVGDGNSHVIKMQFLSSLTQEVEILDYADATSPEGPVTEVPSLTLILAPSI
jgi:hypothetical protein